MRPIFPITGRLFLVLVLSIILLPLLAGCSGERMASQSPVVVSARERILPRSNQPIQLAGRQSSPADQPLTGFPRKVQMGFDRMLTQTVHASTITLVGAGALVCMLICYTLEDQGLVFTLGFAFACWAASAYALLQWPRPFAELAALFGLIALIRSRNHLLANNAGSAGDLRRALLWPTRLLCALAVIGASLMLFVDAPIHLRLQIPVSRAGIESAPLLLVGIAFLVWLAIDRPSIIDAIKQAFIAAAFILWGVDILMPSGPWAVFVGAIVIAIYVFDLAWLMEGNLRKKFGAAALAQSAGCDLPVCQTTGVCSCKLPLVDEKQASPEPFNPYKVRKAGG